MASLDDEVSSMIYFEPFPNQEFGEFVHSNNVLFYFAKSPFYDRRSVNESIFQQSVNNPQFQDNLNTKQRFESRVIQQRGLQYVVAHDPLESKSRYLGPNGEEWSDVWVIRKQQRVDSGDGVNDDFETLGFYYIMNSVIFQAPSVASILAYRLLNATKAVGDLCETGANLSTFSVAQGHTYIKATEKSAIKVDPQVVSKDTSPVPGAQISSSLKNGEDSRVLDEVGAKTLRDALAMTMRYGKEYMDEQPLYGEPGNFRLERPRESAPVTGQQTKTQALPIKPGTATPASRVTSPPPPIQTDVPPVVSKKSSVKSPESANPMKPKRRKSKIANSSQDGS